MIRGFFIDASASSTNRWMPSPSHTVMGQKIEEIHKEENRYLEKYPNHFFCYKDQLNELYSTSSNL